MLNLVPFVEQHVAPFTAWFNALPNNRVWPESYVRSRSVDDPTYDPALMLAAEEDGQPVGFILASVAKEEGWIRAFLAHPDRQRQGIGTALFDAVEAEVAKRGLQAMTAGYAMPRYFLPGVDIHYTPAVSFLFQRGYTTTRETRVNMDVIVAGRDWTTAAQEAVLAAQGYTIRRGRPEDRAELERFCLAEEHVNWATESGLALEREPVTVHLALRGPEIVGMAVHGVIGGTHFGPMLTKTGLRGLGIGTVLLKRCLADWQHLGHERGEIIWAGPIAFYARTVGATIGRAFWVFKKTLPA
jgi:mycothiol synthase